MKALKRRAQKRNYKKFDYVDAAKGRKLRIQLMAMEWILEKGRGLASTDVADLIGLLFEVLPTSRYGSSAVEKYVVNFVQKSRPKRGRGRSSALTIAEFRKLLEATSFAENITISIRQARSQTGNRSREPYRTGIRMAAKEFAMSESKLEKFISWLQRERQRDLI